jgi:hypothetical protein
MNQSTARERKIIMADDCISVIADNLPFPVYAVTKDTTEALARKGGMSEGGAKALGIITGVTASIITTFTTGVP